jgi:anti-sigma factor RsiW
MTCEQFRERLTAFSLGELETHEAVSAREHVSHCSECASSALMDRQLTALVRSSAVFTPPEVRAHIMDALREEAAGATSLGRRRGRRRHWLALGAAAGLTGALLAASILVVPAPRQDSALEAAWTAYRQEPLMLSWDTSTQRRLTAVLGPSADTPDLGTEGLHVRATGARMLAGHLAAVAEYRTSSGRRVTLIRFKGSLPPMSGAGAAPGAGQLEAARWDKIGSIWWQAHGVVYCLIGNVDQPTLYHITDRLRSLEDW